MSIFESDPVRVAMDKVPSGDFEKDFEVLKKMSLDLLKQDGGLSPALFCVGKDKVHIIGGNEFPRDHDAKLQLFKEIGLHLGGKMKDVYGFFFVSEAWSAQTTQEEAFQTVSVSEHPDKKEVLILGGKKINGEEKTEIRLFIRDGEKIVFKKETGALAEVNALGWFDFKKDKTDSSTKNFLLDELWIAYRFSTIINDLTKTK